MIEEVAMKLLDAESRRYFYTRFNDLCWRRKDTIIKNVLTDESLDGQVKELLTNRLKELEG
jgi:hypothetical protein